MPSLSPLSIGTESTVWTFGLADFWPVTEKVKFNVQVNWPLDSVGDHTCSQKRPFFEARNFTSVIFYKMQIKNFSVLYHIGLLDTSVLFTFISHLHVAEAFVRCHNSILFIMLHFRHINQFGLVESSHDYCNVTVNARIRLVRATHWRNCWCHWLHDD